MLDSEYPYFLAWSEENLLVVVEAERCQYCSLFFPGVHIFRAAHLRVRAMLLVHCTWSAWAHFLKRVAIIACFPAVTLMFVIPKNHDSRDNSLSPNSPV